MKLTRGRVEREHTVLGLPFPATVWEDRTTGECAIYIGGAREATASKLHTAYQILLNRKVLP